jgi:crotonobetainyl-CoA:carnitine CoA-transferase CaiB-like acyl-CoA transferase
VPHIQQVVERFFASLPAERAYHDGQAAGLPVGVLNAPEDLFEDAHLQARGFFVEVEHEGLGPVAYPGSIYRFSSFGEVPRTRAPKLGEHNDTVLADPGRAQMEPAS